MEEKTMMPINNQIEPDFLEHIKSTFKRWRDLNTQGVTIGARELSNFAFTLKGASMNSHLGFKYNFNPRGTDADGNPAITLKLYTKLEQMNPAADRPVYEFFRGGCNNSVYNRSFRVIHAFIQRNVDYQ